MIITGCAQQHGAQSFYNNPELKVLKCAELGLKTDQRLYQSFFKSFNQNQRCFQKNLKVETETGGSLET
jgi:hypothetical protein